ncbi:uncharacterized protein LOC134194219 [Corticium candelabrum]|uniref:uncharacterized protein LOC134194219 n=1 Tax=Corticium candelabrum TaxID=121492 RepID=UPI002E265F06|nr:uncharacterized protein LOC134194219 [Corticium candelabrum]
MQPYYLDLCEDDTKAQRNGAMAFKYTRNHAESESKSSTDGRICLQSCCHRTTGPGVVLLLSDPGEWENEFCTFLLQQKRERRTTGDSISRYTSTDEEENIDCVYSSIHDAASCIPRWNVHSRHELFENNQQFLRHEPSTRRNTRGGRLCGLLGLSMRPHLHARQAVPDPDRKVELMRQFSVGWS